MIEGVGHHNRLSTIQEIKSLSPEAVLEKTQRVRESFIGIPIHKGLDGYPYSPFPLTDGPIHPTLVEDMADLLIYHGNFEGADLLVSEGDRGGGLLAQAIGSKTGIPIALANWHKEIPVDMPDVIIVEAKVGFSGSGHVVIRGIQSGQKVIVVDDLLSTGGTVGALIGAIIKAGATVEQAFFVGEKINMGGRDRIAKRFPDVRVTSLVKFIAEGEFTTEANE